jgi:hypothetical protein
MSPKNSRRDFVKKAAYITPLVLTMKVEPTYAGYGSAGPERGDHRRGKGHGWTKQHSEQPGRGKGRPSFVRSFFGFLNR